MGDLLQKCADRSSTPTCRRPHMRASARCARPLCSVNASRSNGAGENLTLRQAEASWKWVAMRLERWSHTAHMPSCRSKAHPSLGSQNTLPLVAWAQIQNCEASLERSANYSTTRRPNARTLSLSPHPYSTILLLPHLTQKQRKQRTTPLAHPHLECCRKQRPRRRPVAAHPSVTCLCEHLGLAVTCKGTSQ